MKSYVSAVVIITAVKECVSGCNVDSRRFHMRIPPGYQLITASWVSIPVDIASTDCVASMMSNKDQHFHAAGKREVDEFEDYMYGSRFKLIVFLTRVPLGCTDIGLLIIETLRKLASALE